MKVSRNPIFVLIIVVGLFVAWSCQETEDRSRNVKTINPQKAATLADSIRTLVTANLAEGLELKLWAIDSLVADPVSIDVDDKGHLYYTRTNRQKHSEFDIRGHQDWEIESISLQSVEDKRKFLRRVLSPENSKRNEWLDDLNKDGSHDWRDMTVEKEQVYRVEDRSGDGVADYSQLVVEDFHEEVTDAAGAILKHNDDLFVGIAPDMWRLTDKDGDGVPDEKKSISHGYGIHVGFSGHGMSGLEVGPEGKIYWQIGDIGFNGTGPDGQKWEHPNSGVIVRANPDGSDFEVFAYGNRNTHEFVFDEYGNLISEDNDGDHPGEMERIVYVVNGADIGWRTNWQFGKYRDPDNNSYKVWMDEKMYLPRFEGQAAYIVPPIANFVSGPTGMLYNPGTALGPEWNNTFFIGEFVGNPARSGIHAFKLTPKGASFELGERNMILSGVLATGIDFGPDGAMYLADWIDGWGTKDHGRIWKLDIGSGPSEERKQTYTLLTADFSEYDESKLGDILRNRDMRVRQKAQFELVKRGEDGLEVLKNSLEQKEHQLARVHAIWGISQFARGQAEHAGLLVPFLKDEDAEIRAQAAKWIGDVRYKKAGAELIPLLKDENSRARFFAAEALGRIAYEPAIQPIVDMLRANNDEDVYLRHAGSLALARIGKHEPVVALHKDDSRAVRIAAVVALRRMGHEGIRNFLDDGDEFIVTEAARAINDDLSISGALPDLGNILVKTSFSNEALIRRAINANVRVGTEASVRNLIDYSNSNAAAAMRAEAIAALSTWPNPSVVDRVDGRYRGVVTRDPQLVRNRSVDPLSKLTSDKDKIVRVAAVKAIGKLRLENASAQVFARLKNDQEPEVRIEALKTLASWNDKQIDNAIKLALSDKERSVRIVGLDFLAKMDIPKPLMVSLLSETIKSRTVEEKQAALLTLGTVPVEHSGPVLEGMLTQMANGTFPPEIQLELAEAIDSTRSAPLIARYKTVAAKYSSDSVSALYKTALLGGDIQKGRRIFWNHQSAQCTRCHSFNDYGGNAGPRLNGVASRLSREQILESLVTPSARIAPGFGTSTVELKNGRRLSGIVLQENNRQLVLKVADKPDTTIVKSDIVTRTNSQSSMPPMHLLLTKREIRDVVSFLSTLKEEEDD
ncbi:MAG TPA: HEAT repeat domain-containing protein [Chryseosolibacter sp.]|nr:HEAT repeat domain-containing protein [Chryseosolibacter sp.]